MMTNKQNKTHKNIITVSTQDNKLENTIVLYKTLLYHHTRYVKPKQDQDDKKTKNSDDDL